MGRVAFRVDKGKRSLCARADVNVDNYVTKQVAYQLGFSCPAAFTAAFRCILGATPRDYVP